MFGPCSVGFYLNPLPARLEVYDPQAAEEVALTLGLVKPASADLTAYKKRAEEALRETGELLPGVAMTEARESFSVKVAGGDTRESGEAAEEAPWLRGQERSPGGAGEPLHAPARGAGREGRKIIPPGCHSIRLGPAR